MTPVVDGSIHRTIFENFVIVRVCVFIVIRLKGKVDNEKDQVEYRKNKANCPFQDFYFHWRPESCIFIFFGA
jgi:large-conductance mechanosensitive channel